MVVLFVIGALVWLSYQIAFPALIRNSLTGFEASVAQQQTISAYDTLGEQAESFGKASASCRATIDSSSAALCLESNDARFASDIGGYADTLSTIVYPASVSANVAAVKAAAEQAANTLDSLSRVGPDLSSYEAAVQSSNIESEIDQIDSTTSALNGALNNPPSVASTS